MTSSLCIRIAAAHPESVLDDALVSFVASAAPEQLLIVDFTLRQYWLEGEPPIALTGIYYLHRSAAGDVRIDVAVTEGPVAVDERLAPSSASELLDALAIPRFALERAVPLAPVAIPKPWGREIWYTGIERRGVAGAGSDARRVPLPWLLALAPSRLCGGADNLILLKILDPLPDAVYGDLYFELHRHKQEVYVVTDVDRSAWPDGIGAIRFGFDAALRRQYGDDEGFLADYAAAVSAYRRVRRDIDALLDADRAREGIGANEPVPAATLRRWLEQLPQDLHRLELERRQAMERFTGRLPLRVGDVVKVPCWVPHSLQHGVRTVEFQTPVYERLILSFAQKVLTQTEWDTEEAVALLQLDPPPAAPWEITAEGEGWVEERIVRFDEFEVRRITLQAGAERWLDAPATYALCMVIGGVLRLDGETLAADQAVLIPGSWRGARIDNPGPAPRHLLWALPASGAASPS